MSDLSEIVARMEAKLGTVTESGCVLWAGSKVGGGYGQMRVRGKSIRAHRLSFEIFVRPLAAGEVVDHICGSPGCVNPQHLRAMTQRQNTQHRTRVQTNNSSGYPGVSYCKRTRRYEAYGCLNGRKYSLKHHATALDAYRTWKSWAAVNMPYVDPRMLSLDDVK